MSVTFFNSAGDFRKWLEENHDKVLELWVGFYKKDSGKTGISYPAAVAEALCFGWIDGVKKRVDEFSYTHRFTPRKSKSTWSLINVQRAKELIGLGQMRPAGLKAFEARDSRRSGIYSFENRPRKLESELENKFRKSKRAWTFFQAQPPGYQRTAIWWVISAKREETRWQRLQRLIADSEKQLRLAAVSGPAKKPG